MSGQTLRQWVEACNRMIPEADRKVLLSPLRLMTRFAQFALRRHSGEAGRAAAADVHARDPALVDAMLDVVRVLSGFYFRLRVEGVEHVPASGPVLLVGNHSGGLVPSDAFFTALAIHDHLGPSRAMYALAHDFMFEDPILRRYAGRLGMLRAGHESARHAFAAGAALLVYPGSDLDSFRSFGERGRVVLGGRKGFLRLALREGVPIVPVVDVGTHEQFVVLTRGDRLAKWLHAHDWARSEVLPIIAAFPWGITHGFVPYLPLPTQTTIAFLPPMQWPGLGPEAADDPVVLERCYREVEAKMQAALDRLSRDRRYLLGTHARTSSTPASEAPRPPDVTTSWMLSEPRPGTKTAFATRIESVGAQLPARRLTTDALMASTRHHPDIDLERLTGIRERRVCGPGEDSLSLAIAAARDCLSRSRYTGADIDMVISASISRHDGEATHRFEPPLSLSIKQAIGAPEATSFDLSNACAGMLTGLFLLHDLVARGVIRRGMVVSGEHISGLGENAARTMRSILSPELASLTLGDAGAAVIVDRAPADHPGISFTGFTTLAEHSRLCIGLPAWHSPGARMFTRARTIHDVAMADGPPIVEQVLEEHGLSFDDIDWLIPHQTSVRAIRGGEKALTERSGKHPAHTVVTVDDYGNTASTTLFLALHRYLTEGRFAKGDRILLLSVASGLEIGVAALVMDELRETHGHIH